MSFCFQTDYDMIDYLNELRDGCLESYTGMVQGLKGDADAPSGKPYKCCFFSFVSEGSWICKIKTVSNNFAIFLSVAKN